MYDLGRHSHRNPVWPSPFFVPIRIVSHYTRHVKYLFTYLLTYLPRHRQLEPPLGRSRPEGADILVVKTYPHFHFTGFGKCSDSKDTDFFNLVDVFQLTLTTREMLRSYFNARRWQFSFLLYLKLLFEQCLWSRHAIIIITTTTTIIIIIIIIISDSAVTEIWTDSNSNNNNNNDNAF